MLGTGHSSLSPSKSPWRKDIAGLQAETVAVLQRFGVVSRRSSSSSLVQPKTLPPSSFSQVVTAEGDEYQTLAKRPWTRAGTGAGNGRTLLSRGRAVLENRAPTAVVAVRSTPKRRTAWDTPPATSEGRKTKLSWRCHEPISDNDILFERSSRLNLGRRLHDEVPLKELDFEREESRVRFSSGDSFVTGLDVSLSDLESERWRHVASETFISQSHKKQQREECERKRKRRERVQCAVATVIQRTYRGCVGRRRAAVARALSAVVMTSKADKVDPEWVEIRAGRGDEEGKDEVWYYNRTTNESQWDRPSTVFSGDDNDLNKGGKEQQKKASDTDSFSKGVEGSVLSIASNKSLSTEKYEEMRDLNRPLTSSKGQIYAKTESEIDPEAHHMDDLNAPSSKRLFKEDGTANCNLRDTISNALHTSPYDSVSSFLASDRTAHIAAGPSRPREFGRVKTLPSSIFLQDENKRMVSAVRLSRSRHGKRGKSKKIGGVRPVKATAGRLESLSLRDVKYTGFDDPSNTDTRAGAKAMHEKVKQLDEEEQLEENINPNRANRNVCFNCWSAGKGKKCTLHSSRGKPSSETTSGGGGDGILLCDNWDIDILRRRYRAEEIQEVFSKNEPSLQFDGDPVTGQFRTVEEYKHPVYRLLAQCMDRINFTMRLRVRARSWFRSFVDLLMFGEVPGYQQSAVAPARLLRLKGTQRNLADVRKLADAVRGSQPQPPVTGTTMAERRGLERVIVEEKGLMGGMATTRRFIFAGPMPVPNVLYQPRKYEAYPPKTVYLLDDACADEPNGNRVIEEEPLAWLETAYPESPSRTTEEMDSGGSG